MRPVFPVNSVEFLGLYRITSVLARLPIVDRLSSKSQLLMLEYSHFGYFHFPPELPRDMTRFRYVERVFLDLFAREGL